MPMNGHTPGVSVRGSDQKSAEKRAARSIEENVSADSGINALDRSERNRYRDVVRRNRHRRLTRTAIF